MSYTNGEFDTKRIWRKGDVLSVTIAPSVAKQYFSKSKKSIPDLKDDTEYKSRFANFERKWARNFHDWWLKSAFSHMSVYLEISKAGLLHWHGVLVVDSPKVLAHIVGYYKYINKDASIDLDTIKDYDKWMDYCRKDLEVMKHRETYPYCVDLDGLEKEIKDKYKLRLLEQEEREREISDEDGDTDSYETCEH